MRGRPGMAPAPSLAEFGARAMPSPASCPRRRASTSRLSAAAGRIAGIPTIRRRYGRHRDDRSLRRGRCHLCRQAPRARCPRPFACRLKPNAALLRISPSAQTARLRVVARCGRRRGLCDHASCIFCPPSPGLPPSDHTNRHIVMPTQPHPTPGWVTERRLHFRTEAPFLFVSLYRPFVRSGAPAATPRRPHFLVSLSGQSISTA